MLKSLRLQNFFSFEDETIEFHPEANVMVGINGAGKSNVLKAFRLLQEGMGGRLRQLVIDKWGGFDAARFKGAIEGADIKLEFHFDSSPFPDLLGYPEHLLVYSISILRHRSGQNYQIKEEANLIPKNKSSAGKAPLFLNDGSARFYFPLPDVLDTRILNYLPYEHEDADPQELQLPILQVGETSPVLAQLKRMLRDIVVYDYFDITPSSGIRKPVIATSERRLSSDGTNLPQMLNTIKIIDKNSHREIIKSLKSINPHFTDIDFNVLGGNIELMLEESKFNTSVHVSHISDGTLRFLCLMAVFFNKNRGRFVCIDEPELGLHPDMLKAVRDAMVAASEETQFLFTTHSDNLLDLFPLEQIRVVEKDDKNSTRVKQLDAKHFEGWYEDFSPGRMWSNGDFGGNRY